MTRFQVLLATLLCLPFSGRLGAQETTPPRPPVSLAQAIDETLERNASLHAARAGRDEAGAAAEAARSTLFPRISFTESWQRGDQPVFVFSSLLASRRFAAANFALEQLNHPDAVGYFHATVGVEQLLFDGGARRAGIQRANTHRQIADFATREASLGLVANVTELYGHLLGLQATERAAAGALAAGREDLERVVRRRDAGVATEADVLALRVHVADMEQRVIQAEGDGAVVRAQLNRLMGAPITRAFDAVEPPAGDDAPLPGLSTLLADAVAGRPELQRAAASERLADAAHRAARSALLPQVAAQAAVDVSGTRFQDRASSWLVGGEVRWSLGTGGGERAQVRAATAGAVRARAESDDARAQVEVDVVTALRQVEAARARQKVGRAAVEQARESQRIVRDRYEAGLVPVNDVLRAASAVIDADAQRVSALVDELAGQARLNRATGRLH